MESDFILFKTKNEHHDNELAKKIVIFLFLLIQIPVFIEITIGEKLDILVALLTEIVIIFGLILIYFKKTYTATTIICSYFYGFAAVVPYVFNVLIFSVPVILAVFVVNTYLNNSKAHQQFNLFAAIMSLFVFFSAAIKIYDLDPEYFTHISICFICFTIIISFICYFKRDVNKYQNMLEQHITFLKQITDLNPHFIYTTDTKNNFTFVNETMRNFDEEHSKKLIGENIKNFWKPYKNNHSNSKSDVKYKLNSFKNHANETRYHEVFETPLLNSNGSNIGYLGVSIDVTEKRVAQIKLERSKKNYRELFENNQLGIISAKNGKFDQVNRAFCKMTGYSKDEIIGFEISKIIRIEDYLATGNLVKQTATGNLKGQSFEYRFIRKDESIGVAIVNLHKFSMEHPDNSHHLVAMFTDISKLKKTEAALAESEAIYRTLVNHAFDGIEIHESIPPLNENGKWTHRMILRNNKLYDLLSNASDNVKNTSFSFNDILKMSPTYQRNGLASEAVIKQLTPKFIKNKVISFEWQYGNGKKLVDTEMILIRFKIEGKIYITSIYKDITEQKKADLRLQKSQKKIERKNEKIQQALDSNDALEKFAFSVSHELKEPLNVLKGFFSLLKKSDNTNHSTSSFLHVNAIQQSIKNMHTIINKFLLFARLDTQKVNIRRVDLADLFIQLKEELYVLIRDNNASLQFESTVKHIFADETLFKQLLQNLISNAIKYKAPERLPKVIITVEENKYCWSFKVQDNGIGIKQMHYKIIFNFFEQVNPTHNMSTGIGLALCKKIVEYHQGEIGLSSKVGKGSIFQFTISKKLMPFNYKTPT